MDDHHLKAYPNKSVFEDSFEGSMDGVTDVFHAHAGPQDDGVVEVWRVTWIKNKNHYFLWLEKNKYKIIIEVKNVSF